MAWPMMKRSQISPDGRHRCAYSFFFCKICLQRAFCCLFSLSSLEQVIYKAIPPDISYAQDAQVHLLLRNSDPKCEHDPHPLQIFVNACAATLATCSPTTMFLLSWRWICLILSLAAIGCC